MFRGRPGLPLERRFEVWSEVCDKKDWSVTPRMDDIPLVGEAIARGLFWGAFKSMAVYTWKDMLEFIEIQIEEVADEGDDEGDEYGAAFYRILKIDDVKEAMIAANFGSFKVDN